MKNLKQFYNEVIKQGSLPAFSQLTEEQKERLAASFSFFVWSVAFATDNAVSALKQRLQRWGFLVLLLVAFSSCSRCYECETARVQTEFCKDDFQYDYLRKDGTLTDQFGETYKCTKK